MYKISLISLQLLFQFDMATDWVQNNHLSFFLKACCQILLADKVLLTTSRRVKLEEKSIILSSKNYSTMIGS